MTRRSARAFLLDIEQACGLLADFTAGKTLADYLAEPMLRAAVERQFEIIGEALNRVLSVDPALATHVTDAPRIVAFRNRLIHGYASVANETVWGVVEGSLPLLQSQIVALLADASVDLDDDRA